MASRRFSSNRRERTSTAPSTGSSPQRCSGSDHTFSSASWSVVCPTSTTLDDQDNTGSEDTVERISRSVYVDAAFEGEDSSSASSSPSSTPSRCLVDAEKPHIVPQRKGSGEQTPAETAPANVCSAAYYSLNHSVTPVVSATVSLGRLRHLLSQGNRFCGNETGLSCQQNNVTELPAEPTVPPYYQGENENKTKRTKSYSAIANCSVKRNIRHDHVQSEAKERFDVMSMVSSTTQQDCLADEHPVKPHSVVSLDVSSSFLSSSLPLDPVGGQSSRLTSFAAYQSTIPVNSVPVPNGAASRLPSGSSLPKASPLFFQNTTSGLSSHSLVPFPIQGGSHRNDQPFPVCGNIPPNVHFPTASGLKSRSPTELRPTLPYCSAPVIPPEKRQATAVATGTMPECSADINRVASVAYSKALCDAARLQMMAAAAAQTTWAAAAARLPPHHAPPPIIIQNTTKAVAESELVNQPPPQPVYPQSTVQRLLELLSVFWKSRINRLMVFGFGGAVIYIYWEWWQHRKRLELMQRRIDANPLLRLSQLLSDKSSRHGTGFFS